MCYFPAESPANLNAVGSSYRYDYDCSCVSLAFIYRQKAFSYQVIDRINEPFLNPRTDQIYQSLQKFYTMLNGIARDVVFFPQVQVWNPILSVEQKILKNIISGEGLEVFRLPYEVRAIRVFVSNL
jgi:hypothetical protein